MWRRSVGTLLLSITLTGVGWAQAQTYQLIDTGSFLGSDVNAQGVSVGRWCEPTGCKPALRAPDGAVTLLGAATGEAYEVNSAQQVLLWMDGPGYGVWSAATGFLPLPKGPEPSSIASADMNDAGVIVGMLAFADHSCPAKWASYASPPVCLQTTNPGKWAWATAINTGGDIVTDYGTDYLLLKTGKVRALNFPETEIPLTLTDKGDVLGHRGFGRRFNGEAFQLKTWPGCEYILTVGMLPTRRAVGMTSCFNLIPWPGFGQMATIWPTGLHAKDLNKMIVNRPTDWHLLHAMAINPAGQIVGWAGVGPDDEHAVLRGYLLQPVKTVATRPGIDEVAETDAEPILLTDDPGYAGELGVSIRLQMIGVQ